MADIRDLSRFLNISIGTVSRALNNRPDVSPVTRARVLEAARLLQYAPNQAGRTLRRGRTGTVAFVLSPHPELQYAQPFFFTLVAGAQQVLAQHGLQLAVVLGQEGAEVEQLRGIVETRWADAIMIARTAPRDDRIAYLLQSGIPFATLGRSDTGHGAFASLDLDFAAAGHDAITHLLARGHHRIATVDTTERLNYRADFIRGCARAFDTAGLAWPRSLRISAAPTEPAGQAVTQALLARSRPPTAVVYLATGSVLGAYRAITEQGLTVGSDVAIVLAGDTPVGDFLQPALTRFRPDLHAVGRRWAEILLAATPGYGDKPIHVQEVMPMALVQRASDGAMRMARAPTAP